jgi:GH35 family endo-1,4-beta-xylanase
MRQTEPARGVFNFDEGDALVGLAQQHNISVRGHNLVWCAHNPNWLVPYSKQATLREMDSVMNNTITTTATHFKGQVYSWDVVNEAIVDTPKVHQCFNWSCALKGLDHMPLTTDAVDWTIAGVDYIHNAFRYIVVALSLKVVLARGMMEE